MNFPIKRSLLATIIIGLSVALSHCAPLKKRSDGKLASTEETIKPVENMKDWLDNQKETIALYKEYLRSLKVIATIIQEEKEKLRGGANLVEEASPPDPAIAARESATHRMTMESSRIRINGKFDLAHWASLEIAATYNISLKMAPKNSFWRFRKRSQIKNRRKNHTHLTDFLGNKRPNRTEARQCDAGGQIILLDDVITTGFTFEQLILSTGIPQEKIKLLALCDAR